MHEFVSRRKLLDYMSKQFIDMLSQHEVTGTLLDGKNYFVLHTPLANYKIVIDRQTKKEPKR